jgi:hypothetical protein
MYLKEFFLLLFLLMLCTVKQRTQINYSIILIPSSTKFTKLQKDQLNLIWIHFSTFSLLFLILGTSFKFRKFFQLGSNFSIFNFYFELTKKIATEKTFTLLKDWISNVSKVFFFCCIFELYSLWTMQFYVKNIKWKSALSFEKVVHSFQPTVAMPATEAICYTH